MTTQQNEISRRCDRCVIQPNNNSTEGDSQKSKQPASQPSISIFLLEVKCDCLLLLFIHFGMAIVFSCILESKRGKKKQKHGTAKLYHEREDA